MKRILIAALVIVMMVITFTACSNDVAPNAIVENPEYSESAKENSLYASMGRELEINGVVVAASALCVPVDSTEVTNANITANFYVDRICGKVYLYIENGVSKYATGGMIDTGYVYSGDLVVNGVKIPWLVDPENWQ